ncbi:hypothetical protein ACFRAE_08355 [Sphingobacterium sp. HJSM2_6]|uniref:hypothetical protein n=1 Tax=Sphingobacterium sp. HJSM2_6 TaxID=3366264 RepID=UPI003BE366ED
MKNDQLDNYSIPLKEFSEELYQTFMLYIAGFKHEEISEFLNISLETTEKRMTYIQRILSSIDNIIPN